MFIKNINFMIYLLLFIIILMFRCIYWEYLIFIKNYFCRYYPLGTMNASKCSIDQSDALKRRFLCLDWSS